MLLFGNTKVKFSSDESACHPPNEYQRLNDWTLFRKTRFGGKRGPWYEFKHVLIYRHICINYFKDYSRKCIIVDAFLLEHPCIFSLILKLLWWLQIYFIQQLNIYNNVYSLQNKYK